MIIHKDETGQKWFVGIYSNKFKDREDEILSWQSHVEYAQWVKETGVKLPITIMHQPKFPVQVHLTQLIGLNAGKITAKQFSDNYMKLYKPFAFAQTEAIIPISGFVLVLGKVLKNKEHVAQLLQGAGWAMSHGFLTLDRDDNVIEQYRSFELTSLPPQLAANYITVSSIKEIFEMDALKDLSDENRTLLENLLKGSPEELEESLESMNEVLDSVLDSKEITEDTEEKQEENTYEELREKIFGDLGVEELQKAFTQIVETLQGLDQRLDGFEGRIKQTERSEDEKVAAKFTAPSWDVKSQDNGEDLSEEDKSALKDNAVSDGKLSGIADVVEKTTDPIAWTAQMMLRGNSQQ